MFVFGDKTVNDLIPFFIVEKDVWVLRDFTPVVLFKTNFLPGDGMDEEQFEMTSDIFARGIFENDIFSGTMLSFTSLVSPQPCEIDNVILSGFKTLQSQSMESKIEDILRGAVFREKYIGLAVPLAEMEGIKSENFNTSFAAAIEKLNFLSEYLLSIFSETVISIKRLTPIETFNTWRTLLDPYRAEQKMETIPSCGTLVHGDVLDKEDYLNVGDVRVKTYSFNPPASVDPWNIYKVLTMAVPHYCTIHIRFPNSKHEKYKKMQTERSLAQILALGASRDFNLGKAAEITDFLADVQKNNYALLDVACFVTVTGRSNEELNTSARNVISNFSAAEISLNHEHIYQPVIYLNWGIPGGMVRTVPSTRWNVMSSHTASRLLSFFDGYRGEIAEPSLLFRNRREEIAGFSLISNKQAKWGAMIIAPSGSGKSFLANTIVAYTSMMKSPPVTHIIDLASSPSYLPLVTILGGLSFHIDGSGQHAINPLEFAFPLSTVPDNHLAFLREFLFPAILKPPVVQTQLQLLERAMRKLYTEYLSYDYNPKPVEMYNETPKEFCDFNTWLAAKDFFIKRYIEDRTVGRNLFLATYAHSMSMPIIGDLVSMLAMDQSLLVTEYDRSQADIIRREIESFVGGIRGPILNRATSIDIINIVRDDILYFYFGDLVSFPGLVAVLFMIVNNYLRSKIMCDTSDFRRVLGDAEVQRRMSGKKIMIIDEIHNLSQSAEAFRLIERNYRQGRAIGMAPVAITQGLREITESMAGKAMAENAALKLFLRHSTPETPNHVAVDYVTQTFGFNAEQTALLHSLRRTKDFSDIMVMSEGMGTGVLRFTPTPSERWMATTNNTETSLRGELVTLMIKSGATLHDAFLEITDFLGRKFPQGLSSRENIDVKEVWGEIQATI